MPIRPKSASPSLDGERVGDETVITDLRVTGELPAALTGQYICLGPSQTDPHTSFGDHRTDNGTVHAVTLDDGRASSYRHRWVAIDTDAPTSVTAFGASVLACSDGALACQVSMGLDTVGRVDLAGGHRGVAAEPKLDARTGELHLLTSDSFPCQLHVAVSPGALTRTIRPIENAPSKIRQLELTCDDVVLVAEGFVGVAPRAGADVRPTWFAIDTEHRFLASSSCDGENVVAYATGPSLVRWTFDRCASTVQTHVLDPSPHMFATRSRRRSCRAQRILWTVGSRAAHKHDLLDGARRSHHFDEGQNPGELVFVPDPDRGATEDGGWLVGFVHHAAGDRTEFVVLDAEAIERPAVATIDIPRRVASSARGAWIPGRVLAPRP